MTWPITKLDQIADAIDYGHTASSTMQVVGPKFLRITDIQEGRVRWDSVPFCECSSVEQVRYALRRGDIVFARTGATTGKSFLIRECPDGAVFASYLIRVRPSKAVDSGYLAHFFDTPFYWQQITKSATGSTQPGVNSTKLKELDVPLPSLSEQKRIAGILDQADGLRRKRQQALALTDQFLRSTFLDLFGDPVTNPKRWPTQKVRLFCELVRGSSPRSKADPRYYGGPVPRLMVADMTRDGYFVTPAIDTLTVEGAKLSRPVPAGTIVMAVSGNVGVTAQLQVDACVHDGFVAFPKLKTEIVTPTFLMICLDLLRITHETRKAGAIFQNLTTDDIKGLDIPIPPHDRQELFERVLVKHTATVHTFRRASDLTDRFFNALVQRAFRGDL